MTQSKPEAIQFADDRPAALDDDLYQWALDAEHMIRGMQTRIAELEKDCCQLIDERDERDEVIDALMAQVLGGDCKEWSSAYGFNDAVVDVECRMKELGKDATRYRWLRSGDRKVTEIEDLHLDVYLEDELDEAIDTAMQKD